MSFREILQLPYIAFVIGMLDAPSIDYDAKKKDKGKRKSKKDTRNADTVNDQLNAVAAALKF